MDDTILILDKALDPTALSAELTATDVNNGALVTFTGMVRDLTDSPVKAMFLEHYPGMSERALETIIGKARQRWALGKISIVHRVGMLYPGEAIVFIGVSSEHRREAFAACQFLMDYLKIEAPFWKKEFTPEGEHWVDAKTSDCDAAKRW